MKKILLKLGIVILVIISLSACTPILYDAEPTVSFYSAPGYYNGNYYRNIRHRAPRNYNEPRNNRNDRNDHNRK